MMPYGFKEAATQSEEKIATNNGLIDDLVLQEAVGEEPHKWVLMWLNGWMRTIST